MNIQDVLDEEFVKYKKHHEYGKESTYAIHKNPSKSELKKLAKDEDADGFRIIVDMKNKDVYVFNVMLLHDDAYDSIKNLVANKDKALGFMYPDGRISSFREISKKQYNSIKKWITKRYTLMEQHRAALPV